MRFYEVLYWDTMNDYQTKKEIKTEEELALLKMFISPDGIFSIEDVTDSIVSVVREGKEIYRNDNAKAIN